MKSYVFFVQYVLTLGLAFSVQAQSATASRAADASDLVQRGHYLATIGDCIACHTAPDGGAPFAGGRIMSTPVGTLSTPNITPDKATGIGDWSDDEFYRALHDGIGRHSEYLYPAFPFPWFTHVTRGDVLAIKAYLFSLPPAHAPRKPYNMAFPFNIREGLLAWRKLFFRAASDAAAPPQGDTVDRGRYLVEGLGHCGECHNHFNVLGASVWSGKLEGGAIEGWYAPNITPDGKQGVGHWTEDQIVQYLETGETPDKGVAVGPMRETIDDSLKHLKDVDLQAIAAYLKSVKPEETYAHAGPGAFVDRSAPGAETYLSHCAFCHGVKGQGLKGAVPALARNGAVLAQGPEDVIRVVLGGLPAENGLSPMPAVGVSLSDDEVGNVADYVRNAFGNSAPAGTTAGMVAKLRGETRTMMAASAPELCGKPDKDVAVVLKAGGEDALKSIKPDDMLPTVDGLLAKLKQASPKFNGNTVVDGFTSAYCSVLLSDPKATRVERTANLGNFAVLVYGQLVKLETQ